MGVSTTGADIEVPALPGLLARVARRGHDIWQNRQAILNDSMPQMDGRHNRKNVLGNARFFDANNLYCAAYIEDRQSLEVQISSSNTNRWCLENLMCEEGILQCAMGSSQHLVLRQCLLLFCLPL